MKQIYQQVDKITFKSLAAPGPLPYAIALWEAPATFDLEWLDESFGLRGTEFWPVLIAQAPEFDPTLYKLGELEFDAPDPDTKTIPARYKIEKLPPPPVPEQVALSDWRIGLKLWGRLDEVLSLINTLKTNDNQEIAKTAGIAFERVEYATYVVYKELLSLAPIFQFSPEDVAESMWRADCVAKGDFSGVWPLPKSRA